MTRNEIQQYFEMDFPPPPEQVRYDSQQGRYVPKRMEYEGKASAWTMMLNTYEQGFTWGSKRSGRGIEFLTALRNANRARDRQWDPNKVITLSFRGNELGGEVGELQNKLKKLERVRLGLAGSTTTLKEVADELGDVVICADLIAMDLGLAPLSFCARHKFNESSEKMGMTVTIDVDGEVQS